MQTRNRIAFLTCTLSLVACDFDAVGAANSNKPSRMREALSLALIEHRGESALDADIRDVQTRIESDIASSGRADVLVEKLAWMFVAKAREAHDDGFYRIARACGNALCLAGESRPSGLLIRGHAAQSMHEFVDAERIARELIGMRGNPFDWGLLGDVLVDRGAVVEASEAYQRMLDLRPCLQSYVRAGHVRWLAGDIDGALELFENAVAAGSRRAPEALAWALTGLARLAFHRHDLERARKWASEALSTFEASPGALLVRAAIANELGRTRDAIVDLERAVEYAPLPEYRWALADTLRASGDESRARSVESSLEASGSRDDPRTFALYLTTRNRRLDDAHGLLERELEQRCDAMTKSAMAFALSRRGNYAEAWTMSQEVLATGNPDARLLLHGALVARAANASPDEVQDLVKRVRAVQHVLFPSERTLLRKSFGDS
ncbi:MAG: hypothetical protein H6832_07370 [Planctomycetes bacterium]|nr:hypothetical protein [Planctomycetota bacterium]